MARRYTVEEVNQLLPEVNRRWQSVLELRAQIRRATDRLEAEGHTAGDPLPADASPEARRDHLVVVALRDSLRDELAAIGDTGCVVRDLDTGLCDWLGEHGGRDVWLCWRFGERELAWFHELDAGFAGRRPVSELTEPARSPESPRSRR
ncbi:MAG TPA: DUF2203 domain-containing protein [Kofleriaceae bacterium]|nr:DUF2203 domain-containing protein [Kofleriaceae bacterium]